jgi:hypothetical protein
VGSAQVKKARIRRHAEWLFPQSKEIQIHPLVSGGRAVRALQETRAHVQWEEERFPSSFSEHHGATK